MMPLLRDQQAIQSTPFGSSMPPELKGQLGVAKMNAAGNIEMLTRALFPEDGDG